MWTAEVSGLNLGLDNNFFIHSPQEILARDTVPLHPSSNSSI